MRFSLCIIIPLYNHGSTIYQTVAALEPYGLPVIVVDDGSDQVTQQALEKVAATFGWVSTLRLPQNVGKGAAVMRGFREAALSGHTHALQVDADGQHDLADIPRFIALAQQHPTALICGRPIYDASAPASRRYGRLITHAWVWVETLSFAIGDSMCGFRLYPLDATVALIDKVSISSRMAFDIEVVVRLYWSGVPVLNVPTRVIYPKGGLSHFNLWRDNLRISCAHTRLVCGMLLRLPLLLWRKLFGATQTLKA